MRISLMILLCLFINRSYSQTYDVVVYGGTAGGVMAAIAAADETEKVLLVEPGRYIGGMVTGGLSHTDYGDRTVIGGLAFSFYNKVAEYYNVPVFYWRGPEPHVGERILLEWLEEKGVEIWFGKRVDQVVKKENIIEKLIFTDGSSVSASVYIDAGYEGDLMARAGVSYTWGREGVEDYKESWAGRQPVTFTSHQIDARINPFNEKDGKLLPLINPRPLASIGKGDKGIQSYCFRLITTDRKENMIPWKKPENYDPNVYEIARRYYIQKPEAKSLIGFWPTLPNGKSDINSSAGISTNLPDGSSWNYPDAGYSTRDSIWQWHKEYTLGLIWFLSTDPDVPEHVRETMNTFGFCRDEYIDNEHFPHQLYIREGRRMKGEYIMTQHDLMTDTVKYDAIGMGSYNIDIREMQRVYITISRFPDLKQEVYNEGYLSIPVAPYEIPYRCMLPKYDECQNLLVSTCVSASHLAFASLRMEPQYMIMGESAGVAASMACRDKRPVQLIDINALQEELKSRNQILTLKDHPYGLWNSQETIIIDNNMKGFTSFKGNWNEEERVDAERYEMNFRVKPKGNSASFTFSPYFFSDGKYKIYIWHPSSKEYGSSVPVTIHHDNADEQIFIDQQKNGGRWVCIGEKFFRKGNHKAITIHGEENDRVVADAVKFERTDVSRMP